MRELNEQEKVSFLMLLALAFVLWQPGYGSIHLFSNSMHGWPFAVIGACVAFIWKTSK